MTSLYRFVCWEDQNRTHLPSLIGSHIQNKRLAYFDLVEREATYDITSLSTSSYIAEDQPLIAVQFRSMPSRSTLYAPLNELADFIASAQDDQLWRMLKQATRLLPAKFRCL
jgi:hypothetical protein